VKRTLWTIQALGAWEQFRRDRVLQGNRDYVDPEFDFAYQFMVREMARRNPEWGGGYPIWAWTEKPDLSREGHLPKGTAGVCLTMVIADNQVLLSDFMAWHCVLNGSFLALSEAENREWERLGCTAHYLTLDTDRKRMVEESWRRIFEFEALARSEWFGGEPLVQAVLPRILSEDVVDVRVIVAT
jgi:Domain of unknown function (DUF3841)